MRVFLIMIIAGLFSLKSNGQSKTVLVSTNYGDMKFILYDDTPKHRDAFIELANQGYYNGTLFYRVIKDFLIQGGSKSSRNAAPGKRIGYGDPDKTVDDEILPKYFHKRGALCAPRQPDEINPFKQSDISQFFVVKGSVYTAGALDTLELKVNRPIRNAIIQKYMTDEVREKLAKLREENKVDEFRQISDRVRDDIETEYSLNPKTLHFSEQQRAAYTTLGGYPELDGKYTVFGECISGFEIIDKISALKTDSNDRPLSDVKITVSILKN